MIDRYETLRDGKWVNTPARRYRIGCCDCGLVHDVEFRMVVTADGQFQLQRRLRRNKRQSAIARRQLEAT